MDTRADLAALELERRIVVGEYPVGSQLPKEADLAESLNVSRTTLRDAVGRLQAQGLVSREQGRGTYVRGRQGVRIAMLLESNFSVSDMIRDMGLTPATSEAAVGVELPPAHVLDALGFAEAVPMLAVHRVRTADGVPAVYSHDYVVIVPSLPVGPEHYYGSLYELLASVYRRPVGSGHARLRAGQATGTVATKLGADEGALTLVLSQVHRLADGTVVMYTDAHLLNDRFTVHVRRGVPGRHVIVPESQGTSSDRVR